MLHEKDFVFLGIGDKEGSYNMSIHAVSHEARFSMLRDKIKEPQDSVLLFWVLNAIFLEGSDEFIHGIRDSIYSFFALLD